MPCSGTTRHRLRQARPTAGARWIDYGLLAFEARVFEEPAPPTSRSLSELAAAGALGGFLAHERFYEIGTPEALAEIDEFSAGRGTADLIGLGGRDYHRRQ